MVHVDVALFATLSIVGVVALWPVQGLAQSADIPPQSMGPQPKLPQPEQSMLPTINWARAEPWPDGAMPKAAEGLSVKAFARDLKHPRWIYVLPNGDVLVAEAASEPSPSWSPRTLVQNWVMRRAGSIVENANRISLLRDTNGDGVADERHASVPVTPDNFKRAETDMYLDIFVKRGALGKFFPYRELPLEGNGVQPNCDTLYSQTIFDLDAGSVTITLSASGKRFISMQVINQDHYSPETVYTVEEHTYTRERIGTRLCSSMRSDFEICWWLDT